MAAPRMGVSQALPCRFLGTSGQNVRDIFRYSSMEDHVEILEWTLRVRHLSPTAPDTLGNGAGPLGPLTSQHWQHGFTLICLL